VPVNEFQELFISRFCASNPEHAAPRTLTIIGIGFAQTTAIHQAAAIDQTDQKLLDIPQ
jgi:hypothetical protein